MSLISREVFNGRKDREESRKTNLERTAEVKVYVTQPLRHSARAGAITP